MSAERKIAQLLVKPGGRSQGPNLQSHDSTPCANKKEFSSRTQESSTLLTDNVLNLLLTGLTFVAEMPDSRKGF